MNRFTVIMAVIVIGFVGALFFLRQDAVPAGEPSNHIAGEGTSNVTLIEYGDFQCPACGQYFPVVNAVKEAYGDEISFQFRHFPLIGSHPNAMAAHRAAEAASKQGKFYEMHDVLYERQTAWSQGNDVRSIFDGYAEELGLDMEQYAQDFESSETLATINADRELAEEHSVNSTPTFFINEEKIDNPRDMEGFFEVIDTYIEEETGEPSKNSPLNQEDADIDNKDVQGVMPTRDESQEENE